MFCKWALFIFPTLLHFPFERQKRLVCFPSGTDQYSDKKKYNVLVKRVQIKSLRLLSFKIGKEKRREHSVTVKCYKLETETIFHTEEALITRSFRTA